MVKNLTARGRYSILAVLSMSAFLVGSAISAQATETSISGSQETGYTKHYTTPRYNSYPKNHMRAWATGWKSGGAMVMGVRNSSGTQIARAANIGSSWKSFYNNSGDLGISPGTFYMNVYIGGACGGSGCGTQNWRGGLTYNIRYS